MPRFKSFNMCYVRHATQYNCRDWSVASYLTSLVNDTVLGFETTVLIGCCTDIRSLIFRLRYIYFV